MKLSMRASDLRRSALLLSFFHFTLFFLYFFTFFFPPPSLPLLAYLLLSFYSLIIFHFTLFFLHFFTFFFPPPPLPLLPWNLLISNRYCFDQYLVPSRSTIQFLYDALSYLHMNGLRIANSRAVVCPFLRANKFRYSFIHSSIENQTFSFSLKKN